MKKFWLILPLLSVLSFVSCSNDDDSYSQDRYWLTSGTFITDSNYYYILTDNGHVLYPSTTHISKDKHDDGDRILVNYTILDDAPASSKYTYLVRVNGTSSILTKGIFNFTAETPQRTKDSIGNNAVSIINTWFTNNYLNVEFEYGGGAYTHYISLVKDETNLTTNNGEIILELKHNTNEDPYNDLQWGIASFDISELQQEETDNISILIRALDKYGNYQYNKILNYNYSKTNTESKNSPLIDLPEFPSENTLK